MFNKRAVYAAFLACSILPATALAQSFPARTITAIVPAPPGGSIDIYARAMAGSLRETLHQSFVVENKTGGGGSIGVTSLANAKPDGYTVSLVWDGPLTAVPNSTEVTYTPDSYIPVMSFAESAFAICSRSEFPANTAAELIATLKQKPDQYTFGLDALGGSMHLAAYRVFSKAGVKVRFVPYGGASEVLKGLLGKEVDLYGSSINPILPHVAAGTAKCLAVTSAKPNTALPNTQGLDSIGLGNEQTVLWWGVIVPAHTPTEIVDVLRNALTTAANTPEFKKLVAEQGATLRILSGDEMKRRINTDLAAFADAARAAGVTRAPAK